MNGHIFEKRGGNDELGGLSRNMHKSQRAKKIKGTGGAGKAAVMGLLERRNREKGHSVVRATVVPNVRRETLQPEVRQHVTLGSKVMTDEWASYKGLDPEYAHLHGRGICIS